MAFRLQASPTLIGDCLELVTITEVVSMALVDALNGFLADEFAAGRMTDQEASEYVMRAVLA